MLSRTNPSLRCTPNPFRFRTSVNPRILHYFGANKSFTIRPYRHPSSNSLRMHTYKNTGRGGCLRFLGASVSLWQILLFHTLADSLASSKKSSPLQSSKSKLFFAKHPGWRYPNTSAPSFFRRRNVPRGASIPCALTRLRILAVATGCTTLCDLCILHSVPSVLRFFPLRAAQAC